LKFRATSRPFSIAITIELSNYRILSISLVIDFIYCKMAAKKFLIVLCLLASVQAVVYKTVVLKWTRGKLRASGGRLDHKNRALYVRVPHPSPVPRGETEMHS